MGVRFRRNNNGGEILSLIMMLGIGEICKPRIFICAELELGDSSADSPVEALIEIYCFKLIDPLLSR